MKVYELMNTYSPSGNVGYTVVNRESEFLGNTFDDNKIPFDVLEMNVFLFKIIDAIPTHENNFLTEIVKIIVD